MMRKLTTYLQLRDRLSQIWLNRYTLMIFLIVVKLLIFSTSLQNALENSKEFILSNCEIIDKYYSEFMDSTPYYLSEFGNYLIEKSIEETVDASISTLTSLVSASEKLTIFVFDLYLGTYLCLITGAIDGAVDVATNTTEKLIDYANSTISTLAEDINEGLYDVSDVIKKVISAIDKVEDLFSDSDSTDIQSKLNSVNLTVEKLRSFQIPSSIDAKLASLSEETPDFSSLMNTTHEKIAIPFELITSKIKSMNISKMIKTNESLLGATHIENSTGICSSNNAQLTTFYAYLSDSVHALTIALIVTLVIIALIVMLPIAWCEFRQWRRLCNLRDDFARSKVCYDLGRYPKKLDYQEPDVIDSYERTFHRIPTVLGEWLAGKLTSSLRTRKKIRWCVAYATSSRALTVLGVAVAGIVVCVCQFILIATTSHILNDGTADNLATNLFSSVNASFQNDIKQWTVETNLYINSTQESINDELFGWIETASSSLNATIDEILDDINTTLGVLFNGTLLYDPMATIVRCTVGNKLTEIEKALTWIHEKAHITLPQLDDAALFLALRSNTSSSTSISQELAQKAKKTIAVLLHQCHQVIVTELIVSVCILSVWLSQWPIATILLHTFT